MTNRLRNEDGGNKLRLAWTVLEFWTLDWTSLLKPQLSLLILLASRNAANSDIGSSFSWNNFFSNLLAANILIEKWGLILDFYIGYSCLRYNDASSHHRLSSTKKPTSRATTRRWDSVVWLGSPSLSC